MIRHAAAFAIDAGLPILFPSVNDQVDLLQFLLNGLKDTSATATESRDTSKGAPTSGPADETSQESTESKGVDVDTVQVTVGTANEQATKTGPSKNAVENDAGSAQRALATRMLVHFASTPGGIASLMPAATESTDTADDAEGAEGG